MILDRSQSESVTAYSILASVLLDNDDVNVLRIFTF
jgi:hypothetical protein